MVSAADLILYLLAIKSFLRFYPSVAVVAHSDGTLRKSDEATLRRHITGCKIVSTTEADDVARRQLGADSFLFQCRGWDACYRRLIDTELLASTPKRIIMDSDVLILHHPAELIHWIEQSDRAFLMGQPPVPTQVSAPTTTKKHVQTLFKEAVPGLSQRLNLPNHFPDGSTAGFYGCSNGELSLSRLEPTIKACMELGIPMREWGSEQCIVIYLLASAGAVHLPPDRYLNFAPDELDKEGNATLIHFLGYCRFYKNVYARRAAQMVHLLLADSNKIASSAG